MGLWDSAKAAVKSVVTTEENPYAGMTYEASPLHILILALIEGIDSFLKNNTKKFVEQKEADTIEHIREAKEILKTLNEKILPVLSEGNELGYLSTPICIKELGLLIGKINKNPVIKLFLDLKEQNYDEQNMLNKIYEDQVIHLALSELSEIILLNKDISLAQLIPFLNPKAFLLKGLGIQLVDAEQYIYQRETKEGDKKITKSLSLTELYTRLISLAQQIKQSPAAVVDTVAVSEILNDSRTVSRSNTAIDGHDFLKLEDEQSGVDPTVVKETKDETSEEVNVIEPEQNLSDKEEIFLESSDTSSSEEHLQVLSEESTKHTQSSTVEQPDVSVENPASEEISVSKAEPEEQQSSDDSLIVKVEEPISEEPEQSDLETVNSTSTVYMNSEKIKLNNELSEWQPVQVHFAQLLKSENPYTKDAFDKMHEDKNNITKLKQLNKSHKDLKILYEQAVNKTIGIFSGQKERKSYLEKLLSVLNVKLKNIQNAYRQLLAQEQQNQLTIIQQTLDGLQAQSLLEIVNEIGNIVLPEEDTVFSQNKVLFESLRTRLDAIKARLDIFEEIKTAEESNEKLVQTLEALAPENETDFPAVLQSKNLQAVYDERLQLIELDNALDALKDLEIEAIVEQFKQIENDLPESAMDINQELYKKVKAQFNLINNDLICYQALQAQQEQLTSIQEEQSIQNIIEVIGKIDLPEVDNSHPENQALLGSLSTRLDAIKARLDILEEIKTAEESNENLVQKLEALAPEDETDLPDVLKSENLQAMYNERLKLIELDNTLDALKDLEIEAIVEQFKQIESDLPENVVSSNQELLDKINTRLEAIRARLLWYSALENIELVDDEANGADEQDKSIEDGLNAFKDLNDDLPQSLNQQNLQNIYNEYIARLIWLDNCHKGNNFAQIVNDLNQGLNQFQTKYDKLMPTHLKHETLDAVMQKKILKEQIWQEQISAPWLQRLDAYPLQQPFIERLKNIFKSKKATCSKLEELDAKFTALRATSGQFGRAILGGLQADCMKFSRDGIFITREKLIDDNKINDVKQMPGFPTLDRSSEYHQVLAKITELADYGQQKGYSQTAQLAYDLGECLNALHQAESAEVPDKEQIQALKHEFNLRLHSRDDIMHKHKQVWKPLLLAAVTAGLSVAVKLISTGFRQCFFDTNRQKQLHAIDTSFEHAAKIAPTA
ncbi:MAG: hypothetical protein CMF38_04175 [Legionellaceae bacterium]|nr:hypothetical protein [Legionellaceae bacterium]|tara:strand:- start:565 stop:4104 length:3540 start_codon:yes stop_codon:yes gene_type:complete